jgi:hypothetical protein
MKRIFLLKFFIIVFINLAFISCNNSTQNKVEGKAEFRPKFKLIASEKFYFNNSVDCNMSEAWIGDKFRIFPGKYGEDAIWDDGKDLKFASGKNADETFLIPAPKFMEPRMPANAAIGSPGLQGNFMVSFITTDEYSRRSFQQPHLFAPGPIKASDN